MVYVSLVKIIKCCTEIKSYFKKKIWFHAIFLNREQNIEKSQFFTMKYGYPIISAELIDILLQLCSFGNLFNSLSIETWLSIMSHRVDHIEIKSEIKIVNVKYILHTFLYFKPEYAV